MQTTQMIRALAAQRVVIRLVYAKPVNGSTYVPPEVRRRIDSLFMDANGEVSGQDACGRKVVLTQCVRAGSALLSAMLFGGQSEVTGLVSLLSEWDELVRSDDFETMEQVLDQFNGEIAYEMQNIIDEVHGQIGSTVCETAFNTGLIEYISIDTSLEGNDEGGVSQCFSLYCEPSELAGESEEAEDKAEKLGQAVQHILYGCESYLSSHNDRITSDCL